jgi:hypothetical protein
MKPSPWPLPIFGMTPCSGIVPTKNDGVHGRCPARNPTEHTIRLHQVAKWAEPTMREGPAGISKRQRVRTLLGQPG